MIAENLAYAFSSYVLLDFGKFTEVKKQFK
jgi:hypothetical protein